VFADVEPSIVVNCAAFTAVDAAETDEDTALEVNAHGPAHVAAACAAAGARLVHVSTDYVFAGDADEPYDETTRPAPRTAYGRTKAAGEQAVLTSGADVFVVRTAWLYGAAGPNFVRTMARLSRERETVQVVDDQIGSPTWSLHLARALVGLSVSTAPAGIYHCTNGGEASWYVFARAVFAELGLDPARVEPTSSAAFVRPAPRPAYSVLSTAKWDAAGLPAMPHWRDALPEAVETLGEELTDEL
jgi:dTDP-4-dehydrorhamnose reductase